MHRFVYALIAVVACADTPAPAEELPDYFPASEYCERTASAFCSFYLRCGRMAVSTQAACEERFVESCNGRYEQWYVALEDAGLLRLHRAGVEACEAHLTAVACEAQVKDLDGPCAAMWEGAQPEGGACGFDVESFVCAPSTTCVLDFSFCGECVAEAALGEACDDGASCGPDASCIDEVCVARVPGGEACEPGDLCALGTSCEQGVCRGPVYVEIGDTCDLDRRCPYASVCIQGVCRASARLGEACSADVPCDNSRCVDGECAPLLPIGASCNEEVFYGDCVTGCIGGECVSLPGVCF